MAGSTPDKARCLKLRSKDMFYKDPARGPSAHDADVARLFGACDTAAYWCDCTQTGRGPDDQPANLKACSLAGRVCYVGIESLA
jgi:hypothetical protein